MFKIVLLSIALALAACSSVKTSSNQPALQAITQERIQLRVRTGNPRMDNLVYELAYQQFSEVIPLREQEPYTGALEITFTSSTSGAFIGTSSSISSANVHGTGWYTGNMAHVNASGFGTSATVSSGTVFEWQNSTMLAVLKKMDG